MSPTYTIVIMVAFVVVIIAVDVVLAVRSPGGDTYSEVLRAAGERWMPLVMLVCFGMGLLAGHWWW